MMPLRRGRPHHQPWALCRIPDGRHSENLVRQHPAIDRGTATADRHFGPIWGMPVKAKLFDLLKFLHCGVMMLFFGLRNKFHRLNARNYRYGHFHSQFGEDSFLFENIDLPHEGVFVDVGAGHPISHSNTYFFEKKRLEGCLY
jgi:hypothetical protein